MVWFSFEASAADLRIALGYQVATLVLAAVLAQATALVVALLLLRKAQFRRRLTVTMAQIAGLLAFGAAVYWEYSAVPLAAESVPFASTGRSIPPISSILARSPSSPSGRWWGRGG